jgi:hypothetical protein
MNSTDWKSISGIVPALPFPVCPKVSPLPSPKKMRLHNEVAKKNGIGLTHGSDDIFRPGKVTSGGDALRVTEPS